MNMKSGTYARRPYYSSLHKCRTGDAAKPGTSSVVNVRSEEEFPDIFTLTGPDNSSALKYGTLDYTEKSEQNDDGAKKIQKGWVEACIDGSNNTIVWKNDRQEIVERYNRVSSDQQIPDPSMLSEMIERHQEEKYEYMITHSREEYKKQYIADSDDSESECDDPKSQDDYEMDADDDIGDY